MAALVRRASQSDEFQTLTIQFPSWMQVDTWVRAHFRYMTEPYEIVHTPELMLQLIQQQGYFVGDCDDVSTFEATIFHAYGFPVQFVAIRTIFSDPEFKHVFIQVNIDGQWRTFDPTVRTGLIHREFERMVYPI